MKNDKKEPFLDRVLLHSKNADERLFDMVLRFITFVILIIIIWIYADLVHAKADVNIDYSGFDAEFIPFDTLTTLSAEDGFLFMDKIYEGLEAKGVDMSNGISQGTFQSSYQSLVNRYSYITDEFLNNLPIPNNVSAQNIDAGNAYRHSIENVNIDDNGYYIYLSEVSSTRFSYYIIFTYPDYQWMYGYNTAVYNYAENYDYSNFYANKYGVSITYDVNNNSWTASLFGSGYGASEDNCPIFSNDIVWYAYGGRNAVIASDFNEIYSPVTSQVLNLNYVNYNNLIGSNTPQESNLNHLYLTDAQVGLSAPNNKTELINSSVVIGVGADDWVVNHPDNFYLQITYEFEIHGTIDGVTMATTVQPYTQTMPIRTFFNDVYTYGIPQLNRDCNLNYDGLSAYGIRVVSSDNYNGIFPMARRAGEDIGKLISDAWQYIYEPPYPQLHEIRFTQFDLSVRLLLVDTSHQGGNVSGDFVKVFDFLTGTESIKSAKILQNQNPWEGEPSTDPSPYVPSDGTGSGSAVGGASARATVGNITVTTGNGYQDTELHQLTDQDIVHNHQKIITVIEDLKYCFHQFAQENNHNSFIQMIYDDYNYIPGIEYITTSIIIICGVCILIFIIKIAF